MCLDIACQGIKLSHVCVVFLCVSASVWDFNMHTDVDNATAYRGCMDTVKESALEDDWEKNPLLHQGLDPILVLFLALQYDDLLNELSPPLCPYFLMNKNLNRYFQFSILDT